MSVGFSYRCDPKGACHPAPRQIIAAEQKLFEAQKRCSCLWALVSLDATARPIAEQADGEAVCLLPFAQD